MVYKHWRLQNFQLCTDGGMKTLTLHTGKCSKKKILGKPKQSLLNDTKFWFKMNTN